MAATSGAGRAAEPALLLGHLCSIVLSLAMSSDGRCAVCWDDCAVDDKSTASITAVNYITTYIMLHDPLLAHSCQLHGRTSVRQLAFRW